MGYFNEKYKLSLLLNGNGVLDNYVNNTNYFYSQYQKTSKDILSIKMEQMFIGYFYFILNNIDSEPYMKYCPIFVVDFRKVNNIIVVFAINFNIIPVDIRPYIVDEMIDKNIFDNNQRVDITYEKAYNILLKYGFEYSIVEYLPQDIVRVHKISMNILPRFICSGYPIVKYDHRKLYNIWMNALKTRDKRYNEMKYKLVSELEIVKKNMNENYNNFTK